MSAPITKPIGCASQQRFLDGSIAGRWRDTQPWTVICGPDLPPLGYRPNDPEAPCEAADFAERQNALTFLAFRPDDTQGTQAEQETPHV